MSDTTTTTNTSTPGKTDDKPETTTTETEKPAGTDGNAEVEKWKTLARENEKRAKANADAAKRLAEIEESTKTETQKANDRAAAAEKRAEDAERSALRVQIALDKGLPPKLASRLQGETEAEMRSDADDLLAELGDAKKKSGAPNFDGGSRKPAETDGGMNERIRQAAGLQ